MKIKPDNIFCWAEFSAGARASARFNARSHKSVEIAEAFAVDGLKRRERRAPRRSEGGSITFIFIVLLSIMVILVAVNGKTLFRLHREVKFMEQQQIKRLNAPQTNAAIIIKPDSQ